MELSFPSWLPLPRPPLLSLISPLPSPRTSQGPFPAPHVPVALAEAAVQIANMYGGLALSSGGDGTHTPFPTACPSPIPSPSTQNPQATELDGDEECTTAKAAR